MKSDKLKVLCYIINAQKCQVINLQYKSHSEQKNKDQSHTNMSSSNPNDKKNLFVGTGYTLKTNRKDGEVVSTTFKRLFGQKPMITTSGLNHSSASTNVTISTPIVKYVRNQSTQTKQPWCGIHETNHTPCSKESVTSGIICPTCNGQICQRGFSNMCY